MTHQRARHFTCLVVALAAAVSLPACGGGEGPTTPRGPTFPSVLGTYSLTFSAVGVASDGFSGRPLHAWVRGS
jgi:hypothetical protein